LAVVRDQPPHRMLADQADGRADTSARGACLKNNTVFTLSVQTKQAYRQGATIIQQGDLGSGFYVLEKGAVEVYKDNIMLNILMYPGTIFGEMGDILEKPRTCTVKARTPTIVTKYETDDIETIIREYPEIAIQILKTLANRLERTTQKLADVTRVSTVWSVEHDKQ
jgi:CRP-like cAMP-binding protein